MKEFLQANVEVVWLFQLTGCLVVFFLAWVRIGESGKQGKSRAGINRPGLWGSVGTLC